MCVCVYISFLAQAETPTKRPGSPVLRIKPSGADTLGKVHVVAQAQAKHFEPAHTTSPRPKSILKTSTAGAALVTPSPTTKAVGCLLSCCCCCSCSCSCFVWVFFSYLFRLFPDPDTWSLNMIVSFLPAHSSLQKSVQFSAEKSFEVQLRNSFDPLIPPLHASIFACCLSAESISSTHGVA